MQLSSFCYSPLVKQDFTSEFSRLARLKNKFDCAEKQQIHFSNTGEGRVVGADALIGPQMCVALRFRVDLGIDPYDRRVRKRIPQSRRGRTRAATAPFRQGGQALRAAP